MDYFLSSTIDLLGVATMCGIFFGFILAIFSSRV